MKKNICKKIFVFFLSALLLSQTIMSNGVAEAAKKPAINKKKATIYKGKTVILTIKNNKKKVTWKSSNKKVATVSKKGVVKGKKKGTAKITAKVGKKKFTCKVTVKVKASSSTANPDGTPTPTKKPVQTPKPTAAADNGTGTVADDKAPADEGSSVQKLPAAGADNTLTVGKMAVSLGMKKSEVKAKLGTPVRTDKAPQGFDVQIYNPSTDYTNYLQVYIKDDTVVGMGTMSSYFSYENVLFSGDTASTIQTNGFNLTSKYGIEVMYLLEQPEAHVIAFTDVNGTGKVYGTQIFSTSYTVENALEGKNVKCTSDMYEGQTKEMAELLNAYRKMNGLSLFKVSKSNAAQVHSEEMAKYIYEDINAADGSNVGQQLTKSGYDNWTAYGGTYTIGGADAFGTIAYMLIDQQTNSSGYTPWQCFMGKAKHTYEYICCGFAYTEESTYRTYAVVDYYTEK